VLKKLRAYLSVAENGVGDDIDRRGIAGHNFVSSDTQNI